MPAEKKNAKAKIEVIEKEGQFYFSMESSGFSILELKGLKDEFSKVIDNQIENIIEKQKEKEDGAK